MSVDFYDFWAITAISKQPMFKTELVWKMVWSQKQGHSVGGQLILFRAAGIELNVFVYIVYIGEVMLLNLLFD